VHVGNDNGSLASYSTRMPPHMAMAVTCTISTARSSTTAVSTLMNTIPEQSRRTLRTLTQPAFYAWSSRDRIPNRSHSARWTGHERREDI